MDYILLILVVILFINKQYNDLWKKDIYNKNSIESKEENFNNNYKKAHYYTDLRSKENIKNSNFEDMNIEGIEDNKVRKNNSKQLDNNTREIIKNNSDDFDGSNEKVSKNLNGEIENKKTLKCNDGGDDKKDFDITLNDGVNIYNIVNDNKQYSLVDIFQENKEIDEQHEIHKENIIENINEKLVDNVYEEKVVNNKDILHKENKDNKKISKEDSIIEEYDINKKNSKSKNNSAFNKLKNKYQGVNVSVVIEGAGVLEGEIVFDFPNIIALKNKDNIIVFIDESKVLSIF